MPDTRLILGNISFQDFEVPAKINFGGKQRFHAHELVGGYRVIDVLGPTPDDIKWSGRFRGAEATSRARACDRLRASGAQVSLMWGGLSYVVILSHFEADYERFYEIPYRIVCTVVSDSVGSFNVIGVIGGLIGDVTGGLSTLASGIGVVAEAPAMTLDRLVTSDLGVMSTLVEGLG